MWPHANVCGPLCLQPSFCVRRFLQVRPRGQSFEAARLLEDWRRGHCPSGRRQAAGAKRRRCRWAPTAPAENQQSRLHPAHRSRYRRARTRPHPQHHRIQRHLSRAGAAHARGQDRKRGCDQRYGCTRVGALARHVDPLRCRWSGGAGHASGACAWPAPLSAHAASGRLSLVPLARHGRSRSASRQLYRPVRLRLCRRRQRPRAIRPGDFSLPARLGAVLHQQHGRR